jgi:hypothetical protein
MYEECFKNLQANVHIFNAYRDAILNGMTQWIAVNMPQSVLDRSPDVIHRAEISTNDMPEPSLTPVSSNQLYSDIYQYSKDIVNDMLVKAGVPIDLVSTDLSTPISGISRALLHSRLHEIRRQDLELLTDMEKELAELILIISNTDEYVKSVEVNLEGFSIDFYEERIIREPELEKAFDKELLNEGLIDLKNYVNKYGQGFNPLWTDEEISIEIDRRKKLLKVEPENIIDTSKEVKQLIEPEEIELDNEQINEVVV